jgi:hypothetical protein
MVRFQSKPGFTAFSAWPGVLDFISFNDNCPFRHFPTPA